MLLCLSDAFLIIVTSTMATLRGSEKEKGQYGTALFESPIDPGTDILSEDALDMQRLGKKQEFKASMQKHICRSMLI